jgi:hypothetical protein
MSRGWLCPVNCSQSIVHRNMSTKATTATAWNIKNLTTFACPSCYKPQHSNCVQCSGSTSGGGGTCLVVVGGSRGIITIYWNHRGHRNPCMSPVSEGLHILYGHTTLIRHRCESTTSRTEGGSRGWVNATGDLRNKNYSQTPIQRQFVRRNLWRYIGDGSRYKYCTIGTLCLQTFVGAKRGWRYIWVCLYLQTQMRDKSISLT